MPRAPETSWATVIPAPNRPERLPVADRPTYCTCDPWPCTEATCQRHLGGCAGCAKLGHAIVTRQEQRRIETGQGLTEAEVEALARLHGDHQAHNSRRVREALSADVGGDPPDPVTQAC
jgi:hypothetical protein